MRCQKLSWQRLTTIRKKYIASKVINKKYIAPNDSKQRKKLSWDAIIKAFSGSGIFFEQTKFEFLIQN